MGAVVFGNEYFDKWLDQKSNEILAKVEREPVSNEDMLILSLKAQVNHFHHMDLEFRGEFKTIREQFREVHEEFKDIRLEFKDIRQEFKDTREEFQDRFRRIDDRFERMEKIMMWGFGISITSWLGLTLKLFL